MTLVGVFELKKVSFAAVGGTFDRLHEGHKALLAKAFRTASRVIIGLTTEKMLSDKEYSRIIEPFDVREKNLKNFLKQHNLLSRARIVRLNNVAGPTIENKEIECVVVSRETLSGAREINLLRKKKGLKALKIVLCKFVKAEDGKHISSTRVRSGALDRKGVIYLRKAKSRKLKEQALRYFKKPFGKLFKGNEEKATSLTSKFIKDFKPTLLISVGDVATSSLVNEKIKVDVGIVDGKTKRKSFDTTFLRKYFVNESSALNPHGRISSSLVKALKKALSSQKTTLIKVKGEEDLAVLPAVLLSPLRSLVAYGQPDSGIVLVEVTEEKKRVANRIWKLLNNSA